MDAFQVVPDSIGGAHTALRRCMKFRSVQHLLLEGPATSSSFLSVVRGTCNSGWEGNWVIGTGLTSRGSISMTIPRILESGTRKTHMNCMTRLCTHRNLVSGVPCLCPTLITLFPQIVTCDQYVSMSQNICQQVIGREEADHVVSKGQCHAPYSQKKILVIWKSFACQMVSRGLWPERSADLDFFLLGNLKNAACQTHPHITQGLQTNIQNYGDAIPRKKWQSAFKNMINSVHLCERRLLSTLNVK